MARFALRAASSLICGGWGFAVPFYFVQDWRPSAFICFTGTTSIAKGTWINLLQMQINSVMKTDVLQIGHKPNWALSLVFKKELGWSWPRELKKKHSFDLRGIGTRDIRRSVVALPTKGLIDRPCSSIIPQSEYMELTLELKSSLVLVFIAFLCLEIC